MAYVTEKLITLLAWLAVARDNLVRHAGRVAVGRVADCGLATGIGIVGICSVSAFACTLSLQDLVPYRVAFTV